MVKLGSLFKSSFAFTVINLTNKIIRFFAFLIIARFLGPELFGTYSIVIATIEIFRVLSDFGIDTILVRKISTNLTNDKEYIRQAFQLKFILNLIVIVIGYSSILPFYSNNPNILNGVLILSLGSFFFSFSNSIKAKFQAKLIFDKIILPTTTLNIFYLFLIYLITKLKNYIEILFLLQTLVDILTFIWFLKLSDIDDLVKRYSFRTYLNFLKESYPLAVSSGIIVIYSRISVYFISFLADVKYVGYYAACYRITESTIVIASSISASLLPVFSLFSKNENKTKNFFIEYGRKIILASILLSTSISLFANPIINILYSGKYNNASITLAILAFWIPFASINMILTNLLIANGKQKLIPIIAFINLFDNIIANFILVRLYQSNGAALSAVITEVINIILQIYFVKIIIPFRLKDLFPKVSVLFLGAVVILLVIFQGNVPLVLGLFLIVFLVAIYYFTGEISREKLLEIITK